MKSVALKPSKEETNVTVRISRQHTSALPLLLAQCDVPLCRLFACNVGFNLYNELGGLRQKGRTMIIVRALPDYAHFL